MAGVRAVRRLGPWRAHGISHTHNFPTSCFYGMLRTTAEPEFHPECAQGACTGYGQSFTRSPVRSLPSQCDASAVPMTQQVNTPSVGPATGLLNGLSTKIQRRDTMCLLSCAVRQPVRPTAHHEFTRTPESSFRVKNASVVIPDTHASTFCKHSKFQSCDATKPSCHLIAATTTLFDQSESYRLHPSCLPRPWTSLAVR